MRVILGTPDMPAPAFRQYIWGVHEASPVLFAAVGNNANISFTNQEGIPKSGRRALGVPPFGRYNHAYVVPAGTPIHTSTARRYDALIRVNSAFSGFATVQFIDTHGQGIPGRAEPVLVTARIPINIE
jgi:hypothetical protein